MKTLAINGEWIEDEDCLANSQALQFGAGLFETIRVQNNEPLHMDAHMARLRTSAGALGLSAGLDTEQMGRWAEKLIVECHLDTCAMKILWTSEAGRNRALFYFRPLGYTSEMRTQGLKVGLGQIRRNPYSRVTAHKTMNYLDNLLERQAAKASGNDESILLNVFGDVAEGTATNVFIHQDGVLITPPVEAGILPGIQRKTILEACRHKGIFIIERRVTLDMLTQAEGIYLSNALMGFMPVSNFMGNCYDKDESLIRLVNSLTGISNKI